MGGPIGVRRSVVVAEQAGRDIQRHTYQTARAKLTNDAGRGRAGRTDHSKDFG